MQMKLRKDAAIAMKILISSGKTSEASCSKHNQSRAYIEIISDDLKKVTEKVNAHEGS